MQEGSYDIVFPVPRTGRTPAQQWWSKHHGVNMFYLPHKWGITGEAWIFDNDGITHSKCAEVRFGQHPYMRGFKLCLAVQWKGDDKFEWINVQAAVLGGTLAGTIGGCTIVFKPNPFQIMRLNLLMDMHPDIPNMLSFIGSQMLQCEKLLKTM